MIARVTRILLLIQAFFAIAIGVLAIKLWRIDNAVITALVGLTGVLIFRIAITINNFYMAWRYRSPIPDGCALGLPHTCMLVLQEFRATMWTSSWTMPFRSFSKRIAACSVGLPVLLIHGYGCNSGYWNSMSKALVNAGITHYAIDLEPVFGSIDEYAALIHQAIETLCKETGHTKVVIVAHSMGGLAARVYLRDHGHHHIAKVITLGTPHHGTALARHGIGINTQQMGCVQDDVRGISSEWLQTLETTENDAVRSLFVSIYSHHDNIISPQTSSDLPGAKNIELHGIGHVGLALHPKVQAIVVEEILQASEMSCTDAVAQTMAG